MDRSTSGAQKRRFLLILSLAIAALVALGVLAVVLAQVLKSPTQLAAEAAPPPAQPVTVEAELRELSQSIVVRGIVETGHVTELRPSKSLAAIGGYVTSRPMASGDTIQTGDVVLEVNGEPVIAMDWPFPAYRDIVHGVRGPDVVALQDALASLGYAQSGTGEMDSLTEAGLRQLYLDKGYSVPEHQPQLGAATFENSAGDGKEGSKENRVPSADTLTGQVGRPYLPAAQVLRIPKAKHKVSAVVPKVGDEITGESAILQLDRAPNLGKAVVLPAQAGKLAKGMEAVFQDALTGEEHRMTISRIATKPTEVPSLGSGVPVTFKFDEESPSATGGAGTSMVTIQLNSDVGKTLAVPVTALYTRPDGSSFVGKMNNGVTAEVEVSTGLTAGGWVAVDTKVPDELAPGDPVIVGSALNPIDADG